MKKGIPFKLLQEISLSFLEQILLVSSWVANISVITATFFRENICVKLLILFYFVNIVHDCKLPSGAEASIL